MEVRCYVLSCPYNSKSKFCRKRVLPILGDGRCGHLYKKDGSLNPHFQDPVEEIYLDRYVPQEKEELIETEEVEK